MQVANFTEFRKNMRHYLDRVVDKHSPLVLHRAGGKSVIVIAVDDYKDLDETGYLLSTEANKAAMYRMLEEDKAGAGMKMSMEDLYAMLPKSEQP